MADTDNGNAHPSDWEEGPTTFEAAADYARHVREHLAAFADSGERHHLEEAQRLLSVLEGYLQMRQRESR